VPVIASVFPLGDADIIVITFSKHRRGEVGIRLFYEFGTHEGVIFDGAKFERDKRFREASRLDKGTGYSASAKFDDIFGEER